VHPSTKALGGSAGAVGPTADVFLAGAAGRLHLLGALLTGLVLRAHGLWQQVMGGDEIHPLRAALTGSLRTVATTYQAPDTFVPMATLCRLVLDLGGTLDERWMRLPSLICGLALIVAAPLLLHRLVGREVATWAAWLVAVAPPLVLYSRIVRAYSPLVLLAFVAAMLLLRWLERPRFATAAGFVGLAVLAVLFHPVAGPFGVAALGLAFLLTFARHEPIVASRAQVVALGAAYGASLLLALAPSYRSLFLLVSTRRQPPLYSWETVRGFLLFEAGATGPVVAATVWAVAIFGFTWLWRGSRRIAGFCLWMFLAQIAGVLALSPAGAQVSLVFDRFNLIGYPYLLILLAAGLEGVRQSLLPWGARPATALAAGLALSWCVLGPLNDGERWRSSFAHHNDFFSYQCDRTALAGPLPVPYDQIRMAQGEGIVLEYPWSSPWRLTRPYYAYQARHHRAVVVGSAEPLWASPRVRASRVVPGTPEAFAASDARFVVVHTDLKREDDALPVDRCGAGNAEGSRGWDSLGRQGMAMRTLLETTWGPPTWSDAAVAVWDRGAAKRRASG
jgi:hypothetical protein